jgi:hypothetical protein
VIETEQQPVNGISPDSDGIMLLRKFLLQPEVKGENKSMWSWSEVYASFRFKVPIAVVSSTIDEFEGVAPFSSSEPSSKLF